MDVIPFQLYLTERQSKYIKLSKNVNMKSQLENILSKSLNLLLILHNSDFGDFCLTPGQIKESSQSADELAQKIELALRESGLVEKVQAEAGYVNIYLSKKAYLEELEKIRFAFRPQTATRLDQYLEIPDAKDKTIVFDYSSPNIAKPFSVGHLRSTVIGQANYNIHKALGYKTVGINHIGDWGTQFGKLIVAIKKWGNAQEIEKNPIEELTRLYQKFHEEAEKDETLEVNARAWFKKLEDGDSEARKLWGDCINWSYREFEKVYKILDVDIDEIKGESFYVDKQEAIIQELKEKNLLKESEGAQIVELKGMPPALIKKSDGATLYMTRDLAALKYRLKSYRPAKIIYHVGNDQSLHFCQLEAVAEKLGWLKRSENPERSRGTQIVFAGHGMMRLSEGKMSTRAGRTVLLEDLIGEAKRRALIIIEEKNPELKNKEDVAEKIGISAIKYADLATNRKSDIVFSYDKAITLQGNSGPYLQYSYARTCALLRNFAGKFQSTEPVADLNKSAQKLARSIIKIKPAMDAAIKNNAPNTVCDFAYELCNGLNSYYEKQRIVTFNKSESSKNIYIVKIANSVLAKIFDLLGLAKLEKI